MSELGTQGSVLDAYGVTLTPGTRFIMNSAAIVALGFPTSFGLYKIADAQIKQLSHRMRVLPSLIQRRPKHSAGDAYRNKNCRLRLLISIVSMSIT